MNRAAQEKAVASSFRDFMIVPSERGVTHDKLCLRLHASHSQSRKRTLGQFLHGPPHRTALALALVVDVRFRVIDGSLGMTRASWALPWYWRQMGSNPEPYGCTEKPTSRLASSIKPSASA